MTCIRFYSCFELAHREYDEGVTNQGSIYFFVDMNLTAELDTVLKHHI